jgi:DNA-binding MarR family transcriptional regulator
VTVEQVFLVIKEISLKYFSGNPPLDVESIADELAVHVAIIKGHITILEQKGLVARYKNSKRQIVLTEKGKSTSLL